MGTLFKDDHDPSDSRVQREIELVMLQRLADQHPDWKSTDWKSIALELALPPVWHKAKPDAVWKTDTGEVVIAECYARIGKLKAGQHRKLAMDALWGRLEKMDAIVEVKMKFNEESSDGKDPETGIHESVQRRGCAVGVA